MTASSLIIMIFLLAGCGSLPRIVFLHDPLSSDRHAELASIYEEKGELDLAVKEGKEALNLDKGNLAAIMVLGNSYFKKGDYRQAEKYYVMALGIAPDNGDILNNLAWLYLGEGRYDEAMNLINKAISGESGNMGEYYRTLGSIYEKLGRSDDARKAFEKASVMSERENTGEAQR